MKKFLMLTLLVWQAAWLSSLSHVLFTPRDDIKSYLLELIKQEKKSIEAAVYMFTDKAMAQALIDAHVRGVDVKIAVDQISMGRFGKGLFLQNNGVSVLVYQTDNFNPFSTPIMHHKFFIFGMNGSANKPLLWTGSFNCTMSAAKQNYENVLVSDELHVIQEYKKCFVSLVKLL